MTGEPTLRRKARAARLVVVLALGLTACTSSKASGPASPSPSPPPPAIAPLTGLVAASAERVERPVLAIKIDNHTAARPHVGLDKADLVYEEPVEGGITRFIAIFQSRDASTIGPVRSARLADIDVLADYGKPALAFSGAAGYVLKALDRASLVLLRHGAYGSIYRRGAGPAPHNLFSSTRALFKAAGDRATSAQSLFAFGELPPPPPSASASPSASPSPAPAWRRVTRVRIPFSSAAWTAVWRYDGDSGRYLRAHGSTPHRTSNGKRISARNVIIMRVETTAGRPDKVGNTTPQVSLEGSGKAVLLRDGVRINGIWSRAPGARTVFTDTEGRPFVLAAGNTWIELVPTHIKPKYR